LRPSSATIRASRFRCNCRRNDGFPGNNGRRLRGTGHGFRHPFDFRRLDFEWFVVKHLLVPAANRTQSPATEQFGEHDDDAADQEAGKGGDNGNWQDFGEADFRWLNRLRDDAGIGRSRIFATARRRLAIARQIGFQQLPLRGGFPLQRP
jgi:hypothetical protein